METDHTQELADQGMQQFRMERGDNVLGTDGILGTLEQVVVDRDTGQPRSLVLQGTSGSPFELPYDLITGATERGVQVSIGQADLATVARPYTPELYVPVDEGVAVPPGEVVHMDNHESVITHIEHDSVDIAAPMHDSQESATPLNATNPSGIEDQPTVILGPRTGSAPASAPTPEAEVIAPIPVAASEMSAPVAPEPLTPDVSLPNTVLLDSTPAPSTAVPEMDSVAPDIISPPVVSGQYLPEGDHVTRSDGSNVTSIVATGILLGTLAAGVTYLLVQRRQRRTSLDFGQMRGRLSDLRDTTASTLKSARSTASKQAPAARSQVMQAKDMAMEWLPVAGAAIEDLRDELIDRSSALRPVLRGAWDDLTDRANDLGSLLRSQADRTGSTVSSSLPRANAIRATVADTSQTIASTGKQLGRQIAESAASMQNAAARQLSAATDKTTTKATAAQAKAQAKAQAAAAKAERQRRVAARGAKRLGRRVRWFRRGVVMGTLWGIFYAPEPGSELRAKVAGTLNRIPGLESIIGESAASTLRSWSTATPRASIGGAGPRPRDPYLGGDALVGGPGTHAPALESTSEAPLQPPLSSEVSTDEVTGITGL